MKYREGTGIAFGILAGVVFGVLMDNLALFTALGVVAGAIFEAAHKKEK